MVNFGDFLKLAFLELEKMDGTGRRSFPFGFLIYIYFQGRSVKPPGGKDFLFVMFEETPEVILFDFPAKNMFAMEKGEGNKLHEMVS